MGIFITDISEILWEPEQKRNNGAVRTGIGSLDKIGHSGQSVPAS